MEKEEKLDLFTGSYPILIRNGFLLQTLKLLYIRYVVKISKRLFNLIKTPRRHSISLKKLLSISANCNSCFYHVHIYSLLLSMH